MTGHAALDYSTKKKHINEFRTRDYRVFLSGPFLNMDLWFEIEWHKKHINNLKKQSKKPHLFHRQHRHDEMDEDRLRHFKEHVIDSIPFHEKIMKENERRLDAMLEIMPKAKYKKLVKISRTHGGTPEYLVFDKKSKKIFFVIEKLDDVKRNWIHIVRDVYDLADVIILDK